MSLRQRLANAASALLGRDAMPQISEYLFGQPWLHQLNEELNNTQAAARVATVSACVSLLANDLAGLPLRFYRVRGDKWLDVDDDHELPKLFETGNPVQSGYEVRRDWASFWYVTGDASLFMERGPSRKLDPYELWAVPGHLLHEVPGARRSVKEFEYLPTHERFPAASFATLRHWSPSLNPLEPSPRGVSPLTAATNDYETLYRQSQWTRRFFEIGGRVATALRPIDKDRHLQPNERKAIQDDFTRMALGIKNLDRVPIIDGLEPVALGITMQEMQHNEVAKNAALGVCRVLHVPPVMIGIKDGGGLSDAGATTDFLIYADHGLRPPARLISAVVTKFVCSIFGPEYRAWLDVDSLMAVQRAKLEQAKSLVTLTGRPIIEVDEARIQLDMDPAPKGEGKGLWAPFTLAPVEIAAAPPEPAPAPAPAPKEKPEAEARRARLADDRRAHLRRWRDADLRRYERQVGAWARARFSRQEDYALAKADAQNVTASRLAKALQAAYSADDLMPEESDAAEAQRMFEAIIAERGEAAAAEAGVDVVISIHQGRVADMIQTRAAQLVKGLDETTRAALAKKIEDITREGGSFEDLNRAVRQVFADRRANALTIARTETAWAYNLASVEAWESAGVEYISWMTSNDDAVRPSHQECEGLVRKIGDPFPNGLRWPGDTNGPADETINCFPAGTAMQGSVLAASRVEYVGPMREIVTRSGIRLSVTLNHPVLTENGFVLAGAINQPLNIVRYGREIEKPTIASIVQDEQYAPARIEDVFDTIRQEGSARAREIASRDFHGDGGFAQGKVEVVLRDRELLLDTDSALAQDSGQRVLESPAMRQSLPPGSGTREAGFEGIRHTPPGAVGLLDLPTDSSGVASHPLPLRPLRIGLAAQLNASRFEGTAERPAADTGFVAEMLERGAGQVSLDEVVEVRDYHFAGHVYDLQSDKGWIVANGIVCSNCRCTPEIEFEAPESGSLARMMDRRALHDYIKADDRRSHPRETLADLFETVGNGVAH